MSDKNARFKELYDNGRPPSIIIRRLGLRPNEYETLKDALIEFRRSKIVHRVPVTNIFTNVELKEIWEQLEELIGKYRDSVNPGERLELEREINDLSVKYAQIDINPAMRL